MPLCLLDTCVAVGLSLGEVPDLLADSSDQEAAVSPVVVGEFLGGLRHTEQKRTRLAAAWLEGFLQDARVLAVTRETSIQYARLFLYTRKRGRPIPSNDLWIAASAAEHRLPLLTHDHHFRGLPGVDVRLTA